jgi:P3 major capsid protein
MSQAQANAQLTAQQVAAAILNGAVLNGSYVSPAVLVRQPIGGSPKVLTSPSTSVNNTIQITPNPVGLLRKFYVLATCTFTVASGTVLTRAPFGEANLFSQIQFTDLNQLQRHSTSGKHMVQVASVRQRWASGAAAVTDTPFGFGSNFGGGAQIAPATITGPLTATVSVMYEVPIMYQDNDFRGAIYLGTTQAQSSLALTLNNSMFAAFGADPSDAIYSLNSGGVAPTITNVTVQATQEYFDQLPTGSDGLPLLPISAMQSIYQIQNQTANGMVANSPYTIPLANLRSFLSAIIEYDNGGVLNPGTDINYWALQGANLYTYWQLDPITLDYITRRDLSMSMPNGVAYLNMRNAPITTSQFGNTNIVLNAKSAASNALLKIGYEFFSSASTLAGGGSIQSA